MVTIILICGLVSLGILSTGIAVRIREKREESREIERQNRHDEILRRTAELERELEVGPWDPYRLALELDGYSNADADWARKFRMGLKSARMMRISHEAREKARSEREAARQAEARKLSSRMKRAADVVADFGRSRRDDEGDARRRQHSALVNNIMLGPGNLTAREAMKKADKQLGWDRHGDFIGPDPRFVAHDFAEGEAKPVDDSWAYGPETRRAVRTFVDKHGNETTIRAFGQ